jgi:hypothetical protein
MKQSIGPHESHKATAGIPLKMEINDLILFAQLSANDNFKEPLRVPKSALFSSLL